MSDPLAGPVRAGGPVRRLNKLPIILAGGVIAVTMFLSMTSISGMNNRGMNGGDQATRATLPTQSYVDKWLSDKPNGVIGEAVAAEPEIVVEPYDEPTAEELAAAAQSYETVEDVDPKIAIQAKHEEAVEKAMFAERQRILEEQMQRQQMAIRSPSTVAFSPKMEDNKSQANMGQQQASDPADALVGMMAGLQQNMGSGGSTGGNSGAGSLIAGLGLGGDNSEAEAWKHRDHKNGFIQGGGGTENYLNKSRNAALGKTEIKAGTTIPAVMITGANSDLPGQMLAQVSSNVWDSIDGTHVLIPQGARLVGRYDSAVQYGQNRLLVVWDRVIYPDGSSLDLDAMQGQDKSGNSGFKDKVNNHFGRIFGSALLMSAITAGIETSVDVEVGTNGEIFRSEVADQLGEVATEMLRKNLRIAPTIEIRAGYRFGVMVNKDIILPPYKPMQTAIRQLNQ